MSVIVTDTGFTAEDWQAGFAAPDAVQEGQGVELAPDA
ncbi:MAG: oxidoreductase, partial [Rhodobacteraceae bacterium]|nr:oxidoreductase [Paracoccaceae bacterium]